MIMTLQTVVRRRFYPLLMGMIAAGFLLLLLELIGYRHFGGAQLIGTGSVVLGLLAALAGIGARGSMRTGLIWLFLLLSLVGVFGEWEHNEDRLGGEKRPQQEQPAQSGQTAQGGRRNQIPPPILAPLSVSGLCLFGAVALLRRDDED